MQKKALRSKVSVVLVLCLALVGFYSSAFAREERGHHSYHYRSGRWYSRGWFGIELSVPSLRIGAVVEEVPPGCRMVIVSGTRYYYYDNVYYRPYNYGYVVVPAPVVTPAPVVVAPLPAVVVPAPAVVQPEGSSYVTVVINVPNSTGGYNPVTLVRHGGGYIGPQGEFYNGNPTVEELRVLYGR